MKILLITAVGTSTFHRAGIKFTDTGLAIAQSALTEQQLAAIDAEKRLSVKTVLIDAIPAGAEIHDSVTESQKTVEPDDEEKATEKAATQGARKRTSARG